MDFKNRKFPMNFRPDKLEFINKKGYNIFERSLKIS